MSAPVNHFSLASYWAQGDALSHAVAYLLLAMSLASWAIIIAKLYSGLRVRRAAPAVDAFWNAPTLQDGLALLKAADSEGVVAPLPASGLGRAGGAATVAG